ncbi:glycoside hydrolase family 5 protein [Neiella marina]|uniref:Glycoside hydrolase family 5 protein n=1 Tax=Neiella holothuriorum TaxID=2870530 RepID=A0ABS7EH92_9GAMM|nr:cellulase family glycosylhydrolase [Neiella holothuriorum]MBW8191594.1 glycoside hydrolase family 5 protein [Neiella holothuriorum]
MPFHAQIYQYFSLAMKALTWGFSICILTVAVAQASNDEPTSHVTIKGAELIDQQGNTVVLRGFGVGGWLMPEGYMLDFPKPHDSPQAIRRAIVDMTDEATAQTFFKRYEQNYVTESDIAQVAAWGFNSIRLPFNAERLMPRDQQGGTSYVFDPSGVALIDNLVAWASKHHLYVILDMHAAPGGQSIHNIADSGGVARLWEQSEIYWPQTIALWQMLAERYKSNPWVIGYDVLNEPMMPGTEALGKSKMDQHDNTQLRAFYIELTKAFRAVDNGTKIMFLEGGFWGQNMKDLLPAWDPNIAYSYHAYPAPTSIAEFPQSVQDVMDAGHPVWFGEWGENWNELDWHDWLAFNTQVTALMEARPVGWSWWTTKKFARSTQPWQCFHPAGFSVIRNYLSNRGPKPEKDVAKRILLQMADNLATDQCHFNRGLVEALGGSVK